MSTRLHGVTVHIDQQHNRSLFSSPFFFSFSSVSIIFVFLSLCLIILCFLFLFYCFLFQASVLISVISFYAVISIASFILSVSSHFSTFSILHHVFPFIASFICVFFLGFPVFLFLYQYIFRLYISLHTSKTKLKSVLMTHDARKNCDKIFSKWEMAEWH
jgi:hypothetical protein